MPQTVLRGKGLRHKDDAKVMVGDLTGIAHREIRSDQALGSLKLALAAIDLPDHGALLELWIGAGTEVPLPHGAEAQLVPPLPKGDNPRLLKASLSRGGRLGLEPPQEGDFRFEHRLATRGWLQG